MKIKGTVDKIEDAGDQVLITLCNCRRTNAANWMEYGPGIAFKTTHRDAKITYYVGREVEIRIRAK